MAKQTKQITVEGRSVAVHSEALDSGAVGWQLRAEIDGEVVESTLAVGPVEGAGSQGYSPEMLQRDFDAARQKLAEEAEWRSRVRKMMEGVR